MSEDFIIEEQEYYKNTVNHSNPADFGITPEEANKLKKKYLIQETQKDIDSWKDTLKVCTSGNTDKKNAFFGIFDSEIAYSIKNTIINLENRMKILKKRKISYPNSKVIEFDIESIKSKNPISEVCAQYGIQLKKVGSNFKGKCPFHKDNKPSFATYRNDTRWKCFSCGSGGSVIDLVMCLDGIKFTEACKKLS